VTETALELLHSVQAMRGPRRHVLAAACCAGALVLTTIGVELISSVAPVLSLGVLYVFPVLAAAIAFGVAYSVVVSVASMLAFNWFFLPPVHTFTLADSRNWFALAVYLVTAMVVSSLTARSRSRAVDAERREQETAVIADLATSLLGGMLIEQELDRVAGRSARVLGATTARIELGPPRPPPAGESPLELRAAGRLVGTLYVDEQADVPPAAQRRFLPALSSLLAVALDRERLAEQALEAEALRRSDTTKTAVLQAVSHDFRSPLTAIRTAVDGLQDPALELTDEDRDGLLETIQVETGRLTRLVSNLLDLSRLQANAAEPAQELWTADSLIAQALAGLDERGHEVQVHVPSDLPPVRIDPVHAQRILVNLLENAIRHSPPGEPVTVRGSATRQEVLLRVIDRGPGIPAADLERIFEPFTTGDGGGGNGARAGLGLAIARGFAQANGGRLWAESQPAQGASFALALPVQESSR
jgi:two-component system, OmpR family, sensor histidine kinase KdpD